MQLHQLKRNTPNRKSKYIGRGGKRGKTSGRGTKGQLARSGRKLRPELRDIIKKLPKLRGYSFASFQKKYALIDLARIDKAFKDEEEVNLISLHKKGLVKKFKGTIPNVKILADGDLSKKITVKGVSVSDSARVKIEKAGGKISEESTKKQKTQPVKTQPVKTQPVKKQTKSKKK
ncbi:MAG: 50S ribosomal protein L15 [Candidatus Nomurabacteria bacterium GW2011_GWB1_37_5]|uniref:Large ribosomal subunit protein uL15 n=1 Tax=Candidatus Nomurabacteria bacterium GW2011_GWB1_37_5 TaxID=1618742 RepID=A0A0G0JCN6_9BACT|nr:MAG: 50S ribosomal protein L15 [Candidatus Nomurabacteria bacterium GW2011_GWB1_37_5]